MRPGNPLLDGHMVFVLGNPEAFALGTRIITDGAALGKAFGEGGEGGKTNNVCDGAGSGWKGIVSSSASVLEALLSGGGRGRPDPSSAATIERRSEEVDELAPPDLDDLS